MLAGVNPPTACVFTVLECLSMDAIEMRNATNRPCHTDVLASMSGLQVMDSIAVPFIAVDENDVIAFFNVAAKQLLGLSTPFALGRHWSEVMRFCDCAHRTLHLLPSALAGTEAKTKGEPWIFMVRDDHVTVPVQLFVAPLEGVVAHGIGVVLYDQSNAQRLVKRLTHRCEHDDLTGLVNRAEFEKRLTAAIRGARNNGHAHVLCFMDLNEFKAVNDNHGHQAGDEVLQHVANRFRTLIRDRDTLARLGGDEFALLMEHCSVERAVSTARLMRFTLKQSPLIWGDKCVTVGISIGITPIDARSADCRAALSAADAACYAAKREGYDSICVFTEQQNAGDADRREQHPPH